MPNILDDLKTKKKIKRYLKGVHFDFDGAEVSYTTGAGAASLLNEPYLLKSLDEKSSELTDEEAQLLKKLTPESPLSGEEVGDGDVNINDKKGDDIMSKELQAEVAELRKELAIEKAKGDLGKYSFDQELVGGVATALASLKEEDRCSVIKALDYLVDCGEYALAVEKQVKVEVKEENELQKQLKDEAGEESGQETVQLTRAEIIDQKTQEALAKGGK